MSREANTATASDCTGNRFVAGFVTHKRLRLLCEGLDAAEALMADGVITATNDDPDKAFSCLRRGALDAIRLKDEEGAFEEHFISLTQRMSEGDIRMMWNYLVDYVKKRGRPLSKRPIMEAIAAYLELAMGTSWRPYLDELLSRADMAPEFLEAFRAEVVIKPRELRERRPSPNANSPRAHSLNRTDHRKSHAPEKRSSGPGFRSLMPPGYSTSSGSTSTGRRSEPADRKTSPQNRNTGKTISSRPTAAKVESTTIESDPKKPAGLDNWWESPAQEPLHPRPSPNPISAEDCWWLNPPIFTTSTDVSSSAPLQGSVTTSSSAKVISVGSVVQANATSSTAPEAKKLSASGVVLGPIGATNTAVTPHTGKALSSSAPLVATAVLPKGTMQGTSSSVPLTGSIVTTHERTSSEPDASQNFPFGSQSLLRSDGIPISQSFPSAAPSSQQYVSPLRGQQTPSIGHPQMQQQQQVPQQRASHQNVISNGSHQHPLNFSHPSSSRQGNYPSVSTNPMMGSSNPMMGSPHINNKTNPFADLGQWCEEEMDSFSPKGANDMQNDANDEMNRNVTFDDTPSEKKKKKKKKKEKDDDPGDIPKLRAPRTTGATRSTISGESTSGADQSLWDDKSGVFSKFSH